MEPWLESSRRRLYARTKPQVTMKAHIREQFDSIAQVSCQRARVFGCLKKAMARLQDEGIQKMRLNTGQGFCKDTVDLGKPLTIKARPQGTVPGFKRMFGEG
jgi:hypothetical protein